MKYFIFAILFTQSILTSKELSWIVFDDTKVEKKCRIVE